MKIISPEQKLLIRLILFADLSWDKNTLYEIPKYLGASPDLNPDFKAEPGEWPVLCAGCLNTHTDEPSCHYPVVISRCPECSFKPLLAYTNSRVWKGEAKLWYIEQVIHFPSIKLRNIAIHEAIQHERTSNSNC